MMKINSSFLTKSCLPLIERFDAFDEAMENEIDLFFDKLQEDDDEILDFNYAVRRSNFGRVMDKSKFFLDVSKIESTQSVIATLSLKKIIVKGLQEKINEVFLEFPKFSLFYTKIYLLDNAAQHVYCSGVPLTVLLTTYFFPTAVFGRRRRYFFRRSKSLDLKVKTKRIKRKYFLHVTEFTKIYLFLCSFNYQPDYQIDFKSLIGWLRTYRIYIIQ